MKLSNCLANCTCHLLKVEDATESSAFFLPKAFFFQVSYKYSSASILKGCSSAAF